MAYTPNNNISIERGSPTSRDPSIPGGRSSRGVRNFRNLLNPKLEANLDAEDQIVPPVEDINPIPKSINTLQLEEANIIENNVIKLDREIFSRSSFNSIVPSDFEELSKKEDTFSITQFFQLYNSLFFDIPKIGTESHVSIINQSREYIENYNLDDPKDDIIDTLNNRIQELEEQLLLANQTEDEHPFFRNGTIVSKKDSPDYYYMDKGFKRQINYNADFHRLLINTLGYNVDDYPDGPNWYPYASVKVLSNIKSGPNLDESNFDQPTFIRDGELIIGESDTGGDPRDAQIEQLRNRIREIESGDFSSLPALDKVSIDISEIFDVGDDIRDRVDNRLSQLVAPLPNVVKKNDKFQKLIDDVSKAVSNKAVEALQNRLNG